MKHLALAAVVLVTTTACDLEFGALAPSPQLAIQSDTLVASSENDVAISGAPDDLTRAPLQHFRARVGIDISEIEAKRGFLETPWSVYHQFRRHFDPATGAPITHDDHVPGAMIPVPATIEVSYFYGDDPTALCPTQTVQSSRDGFFTFTLPACPSYMPFRTPDMIVATVILDYEVRGAWHPESRVWAPIGRIRGAWDDANTQLHYPHNRGPILYTDEGKDYTSPRFRVVFNPHTAPPPGPGDVVHDLGARDVRPELPAQAEGSLSLTLSNWQKVVEMHHRLHEEFLAVDDVATYQTMFVDHALTNCWGCYSVKFDSPSTSVYGGRGLMVMSPIRPDVVWVDGVHPVGHEFGHSVHSALAQGSWSRGEMSYAFAGSRIDSNGDSYGGHHFPDQHQEMGTAFFEGIATGIGEYMVNGCDAPWRELQIEGGPRPDRDRTLRPTESCDAQSSCTYHNFRWQMVQRGVAEGSAEWELRQQLAQSAHSAYQNTSFWNLAWNGSKRMVTSNSEDRVARFACDLLTGSTDIAHDTGQRAGMEYTYDGYVYLAGRAHDGAEAAYEIRSYEQDVEPKGFQLSLPALLEGMDAFVPAHADFPQIGDPAYPARRLSVRAWLAPQSLGLHMVDEGKITRDDLNNVLRANYMEEATWPTPGEGEWVAALDDDLPILVQDLEIGPGPVEETVVIGPVSGPAPALQPGSLFQTLR